MRGLGPVGADSAGLRWAPGVHSPARPQGTLQPREHTLRTTDLVTVLLWGSLDVDWGPLAVIPEFICAGTCACRGAVSEEPGVPPPHARSPPVQVSGMEASGADGGEGLQRPLSFKSTGTGAPWRVPSLPHSAHWWPAVFKSRRIKFNWSQTVANVTGGSLGQLIVLKSRSKPSTGLSDSGLCY